jgi:hypothetical protein
MFSRYLNSKRENFSLDSLNDLTDGVTNLGSSITKNFDTSSTYLENEFGSIPGNLTGSSASGNSTNGATDDTTGGAAEGETCTPDGNNCNSNLFCVPVKGKDGQPINRCMRTDPRNNYTYTVLNMIGAIPITNEYPFYSKETLSKSQKKILNDGGYKLDNNCTDKSANCNVDKPFGTSIITTRRSPFKKNSSTYNCVKDGNTVGTYQIYDTTKLTREQIQMLKNNTELDKKGNPIIKYGDPTQYSCKQACEDTNKGKCNKTNQASDANTGKCPDPDKNGKCLVKEYSDSCKSYSSYPKVDINGKPMLDNEGNPIMKKVTLSTCACDKDNCWDDYCWDSVNSLKEKVNNSSNKNPYLNNPKGLCKNVMNECRNSINRCDSFTNPLAKLRCKNLQQAYVGVPIRYKQDKTSDDGYKITSDNTTDDCLFGEADSKGTCNTGMDALRYMQTKDSLSSSEKTSMIKSLLCTIATSVFSKPTELGCKGNTRLDISDWFYTNMLGASNINQSGSETSKWTYNLSTGIYIIFYLFFILNTAGGFNNAFKKGTPPSLYQKPGSGALIIIFIILLLIFGFTPFFIGIIDSNSSITGLNVFSVNKDDIENVNNFEKINLKMDQISQSEYVENKITDFIFKYGYSYVCIAFAIILLAGGNNKGFATMGFVFSILTFALSFSGINNFTFSSSFSIGSAVLLLIVSIIYFIGGNGYYPKIFKTIFTWGGFGIASFVIFTLIIMNYMGGLLGLIMPSMMIILTIVQKILDTSWGNVKEFMSGSRPVLGYLLPNIIIKTIIAIFAMVGIGYLSSSKNNITQSVFVSNIFIALLVLIIIQFVFVITKTFSTWFNGTSQANKYFLSNYLVRGWFPFGVSALLYFIEFILKSFICGGNSSACSGYEGLFNSFAGINTD